MEIKKENVLAAYETARKTCAFNTMKVLEALFGKDTFWPKDITERIKTFEDACRELEERGEGELVRRYRYTVEPDIADTNLNAYMKLRIICAALNEGWEPKFTEDEVRWYPWFWLYTQEELDEMSVEEKKERRMMDVRGRVSEHYAGFGSAYSYGTPSYTIAYTGSRLCLKSEELATYCAKQFIDIWADFSLIKKITLK